MRGKGRWGGGAGGGEGGRGEGRWGGGAKNGKGRGLWGK